MLVVILDRDRDKVFKEEHRPPAPPKTEENPIPRSEARSEKQVGAPAVVRIEKFRGKEGLSAGALFRRQWAISKGFDLSDPPFGVLFGLLIVKRFDINRSKAETCMECVEFAIESENKDKNTNLKLVRIVKYNVDFDFEPWGEMYYITFKAEDEEGREDDYQAKVYNPRNGREKQNPELLLCAGVQRYWNGKFVKDEDYEEGYEPVSDLEDDEDGEEEDLIDYYAREKKVLIFRKRPIRRQGGVEEKPERGQKRCRCGEKKEGCGKGGRSCCDGGVSS